MDLAPPNRTKSLFCFLVFGVGVSSWVLSFGYALTAMREVTEFATRSAAPAPLPPSLHGTYRCWEEDPSVDQPCESTLLTFETDGMYSWGTAKGTFRITGKTLQMENAGAEGQLLEGGSVIVLERPSASPVTYLRQRR